MRENFELLKVLITPQKSQYSKVDKITKTLCYYHVNTIFQELLIGTIQQKLFHKGLIGKINVSLTNRLELHAYNLGIVQIQQQIKEIILESSYN